MALQQQTLDVGHSWSGEALESPAASFELSARPDQLTVRFSAVRHGDDPPPPANASPSGRCERLWDYEVVELFLLGSDDNYLELEWGPAGHWLALRLRGARRAFDERFAVETRFFAEEEEGGKEGQRWGGEVTLEADCLPPGLRSVNAHCIHGSGSSRRYCSHRPALGDAPDFHRLDAFAPLDAALLETIGPTGARWD